MPGIRLKPGGPVRPPAPDSQIQTPPNILNLAMGSPSPAGRLRRGTQVTTKTRTRTGPAGLKSLKAISPARHKEEQTPMASPVNSLLGATSTSPSSSNANSSGLGATVPSEGVFLQLLVSQLKNQDPLNPTDSTT